MLDLVFDNPNPLPTSHMVDVQATCQVIATIVGSSMRVSTCMSLMKLHEAGDNLDDSATNTDLA